MEIGVIVPLKRDMIDEKIKEVHDHGFNVCQLTCWDIDMLDENTAALVKAALEKYGVRISTIWCGWNGPRAWNFTEGPLTLGLVPAAFRFERLNNLKKGSDFAKMLGVDKLATHVGFIPEDMNSTNYRELLAVLKDIVAYCKKNGQSFLFETGQETPVTLLRTIEDIGSDNVGINLDPANLILYGKGNPVDALDVFAKYVKDFHAKDGLYPTDGKRLGKEVRVGEGKADFPRLIQKLKDCGYDGTLIIEREISGEQQAKDIQLTKEYLSSLI